MKWFRKISLVFCSLLVASIAFGQVKFYAATNTKTVAVNQNFQVDFTLENGEPSNLKLPNLNDFQVLSGPNQSQNMQWINGKTSQSISYSLILRPKKEGTFKIGKATATVQGVNMETVEIPITVTGPAQQQAQQQRRNPNPFDPFGDDDPNGNDPFDPFGQMQQQQQQEEPPISKGDVDKQIKDNVFVRMVTNKNNVYMGEQLTATLKLYYRLNFGNTQIAKAPSFNGFWSQDVTISPNQKPTVETINGVQYYVLEVLKYNLYPQKSGTLQISPAELNMVVQAQVQTKRRSVWDNIFGGGNVQNFQYKPTSNPLSVNVKELPEAGKPANFSGAVGKFNYQANLSAKEGKTDDAVTYTVKISGAGNLKMVEANKPELPAGFEVYDPKTKEDIANTAEGMSGTKQYDYLIIPREPGEFKIEKTGFSYFDPSVGKYFSLTSQEFTIKVTGEPSKNPNTNQPTLTNKEDVATVGADIRYIKTKSSEFVKNQSAFFGSWSYGALLLSPFLLFAGLVFARKKNEEMSADIVGSKKRRATKLAKKRLSLAEKFLSKNNKEGFYNEVSRAIWGYLGDKLNIDQSQLSKDNVEEKLLSKQVKIETITRLKNLISTCELALYAPVGAADEMKKNYNGAMELIADLEDEIK